MPDAAQDEVGDDVHVAAASDRRPGAAAEDWPSHSGTTSRRPRQRRRQRRTRTSATGTTSEHWLRACASQLLTHPQLLGFRERHRPGFVASFSRGSSRALPIEGSGATSWAIASGVPRTSVGRRKRTIRGRTLEMPTLELSPLFGSFVAVKLRSSFGGHAVRLGDQASGAHVLGGAPAGRTADAPHMTALRRSLGSITLRGRHLGGALGRCSPLGPEMRVDGELVRKTGLSGGGGCGREGKGLACNLEDRVAGRL